jgi:hypothetical protein
MILKVKPEFVNTIFGFNNSAAPLGERTDLHLLLKDGKATNNQRILGMFEEVSDQEIKDAHGEDFIAKMNTVTDKK